VNRLRLLCANPGPGRRTLLLASLLALCSCARMPELGSLPHAPEPADWTQGLSQAKGNWPDEQWWVHYGDPQLNQLIHEAIGSAPGLAAAEARLARASATIDLTDAATEPQLAFNADAETAKQSYNLLIPRASLPQGTHGYARTTLDFSWEIDFWGKNRAALAAATSQRTAAAAETAQARLILTTSIASAYADLARLFAAEDTALRAVEIRRQSAQLFQQRFDHGLETLSGVRLEQARYQTAQVAFLATRQQLALTRNRIAALMGKGPERGLSITRPQVRLDQKLELPATLRLELLGRRPDIVAARMRAEAARSLIDKARAEFYPNVNLSGFIGMQSLGISNLNRSGSEIGSLGPAISLPIFSGGRLSAQLKGARADYAEAVANYNQTVSQALQSVADATISKRDLKQQLSHAIQAEQAAHDAWNVAQNRYKGGMANMLEVLNAEDTLLASQNALTDLEARAFAQDVALVQALGGGFRAQ
jgi:NodT family efflux transporter outer membrane factor (OMF) lipoprotein